MTLSDGEVVVTEFEPNTAPRSAREAEADIVDRVISQRFANRFFSDKPVGIEVVKAILNVARFAPSGGNTQPWRVYVLGGAEKQALSDAMIAEHEARPGAHKAEYNYYPDDLPDLYRQRKSDWGTNFYGFLGIRQDDEKARLRQTGRNFLFFDAPVGLLFTIDRTLGMGSWIDLGMFLQNVMVCAKARGLDTCPQESVSRYHMLMRQHLPIGDNELVVCGMSMGFANKARLPGKRTINRIPLEEFASFHGL